MARGSKTHTHTNTHTHHTHTHTHTHHTHTRRRETRVGCSHISPNLSLLTTDFHILASSSCWISSLLILRGMSTVLRMDIHTYIQGGAERTPLFEKRINSKRKKIRQIFFLFLESTQNAVLHQYVLNKTSLKWRP